MLNIAQAESEGLFNDLRAGKEMRKPGWVRLNFSYLMDDAQVRYVLDSVNELTARLEELEKHYTVDPSTARFSIKPDSRAVA